MKPSPIISCPICGNDISLPLYVARKKPSIKCFFCDSRLLVHVDGKKVEVSEP